MLQEADAARLSGSDALAERLRGRLADAEAALADRDARLALLGADKAYLGKEVQVRCWAAHAAPAAGPVNAHAI